MSINRKVWPVIVRYAVYNTVLIHLNIGLLTYLVELGIETRSLNVGRIISALCAHWFRRILHVHQLWLQTALLWSPAKLLSPSVCCLVPSPGAWVIQLSSIIEVIIGYMVLLLSLVYLSWLDVTDYDNLEMKENFDTVIRWGSKPITFLLALIVKCTVNRNTRN